MITKKHKSILGHSRSKSQNIVFYNPDIEIRFIWHPIITVRNEKDWERVKILADKERPFTVVIDETE